MRKILTMLVFVVCLLMCLCLLGCSNKDNNKETTANGQEYKIVNYAGRDFMIFDDASGFGDGRIYTLYVDCETKVQYLIINGDNSYCATAITIVDETGKPILWEE